MTDTGLPPGWTLCVSRTHNRAYYLNQATKELSWEAPFGTDQAKLDAYVRLYKDNGYKPVVASDGKIKVSHLLVKHKDSRRPKSWKLPDGISITRDEAITIAKKFREQIVTGDKKLADLAVGESDCSSHAVGGDLGYFGRGQMQPSFEEAAYGLHVGGISDLVESDSGIHIVQRTA